MRRCRCLQKSCPVCMVHLSLREPLSQSSAEMTSSQNAETKHKLFHSPTGNTYLSYFKVSEFGPLLLSIFQRKSDSQQAWRQESLSTCLLTHISLDLVHNPCMSPFVICKWKKLIPHALLSMQGDIRCICRNPQPRGPMKAAFLCSHVPLPLISSYFTRGAVNRPLSLRSPSSYRLKRGNHDSDPSSSILSSFLLNLSVL